jgi:transglutaminase-like putative cysteine protease
MLTIEDVAKSLKRDTEWLTARAIEKWVRENIEYKFFYYARGDEATWADKTGDCSDMALLMKEMMRINGIKSTVVHGWGTWTTDKGKERFKHDWLRATIHDINGHANVRDYDGVPECELYEYVGEGFW